MITSSTRERVDRLASLLGREREALAEFIAELLAFDNVRGWEELGYPSLFEFLVRELRLSRGNAFYRAKAVALARQFPEVLASLRDGKLCLSSLPEVARVLTRVNATTVLPRFFYLSREDAKLLSAELAPRDVVPLREVASRAGASSSAAPRASTARWLTGPVDPPAPAAPVQLLNCNDPKALDRTGLPLVPLVSVVSASSAPAPMSPPATVDPMTAELSRVHLTVTRELLAKVEAARLAISHARPGATIADILELGADAALAKDARRKGVVEKPRRRRGDGVDGVPRHAIDSSYVPAEIRRAVWARDGGCCQWKLASGELCGSRYRTQLDHVAPRGQGGETTVENLRVLCQRHNLRAARLAYGDGVMKRYARAG